MSTKISHAIQKCLGLVIRCFLQIMPTMCLFFSVHAEAIDVPKVKGKQDSVYQKNFGRKCYISKKSIKIYKKKLFVWQDNRLFSPKTLHCDQGGFYVLPGELGNVLAKSISRTTAQKIKIVICPRCKRRFRTYADLYDHLSESPPCEERGRE